MPGPNSRSSAKNTPHSARSRSVDTLQAYVHAKISLLTTTGRFSGQLLRHRPAVRVAHDGAAVEASLRHHYVEIGRERRHIVRAAQIAALAVTAQVGNEHPEAVLEQFDERIEHRARGHDPVQQQQGFAVALDAEEDAVRRAELCELAGTGDLPCLLY